MAATPAGAVLVQHHCTLRWTSGALKGQTSGGRFADDSALAVPARPSWPAAWGQLSWATMMMMPAVPYAALLARLGLAVLVRLRVSVTKQTAPGWAGALADAPQAIGASRQRPETRPVEPA